MCNRWYGDVSSGQKLNTLTFWKESPEPEPVFWHRNAFRTDHATFFWVLSNMMYCVYSLSYLFEVPYSRNSRNLYIAGLRVFLIILYRNHKMIVSTGKGPCMQNLWESLKDNFTVHVTAWQLLFPVLCMHKVGFVQNIYIVIYSFACWRKPWEQDGWKQLHD